LRTISLKNFNKKHSLNEKFLKGIASDILKGLKKEKTSLEVVFLSDPAIKKINKKYKNRNRPTDVLSFDLGTCGHILISSDTALKNSKIFHTSFEKELVLYVIHGILHLFGYEDYAPLQKKRMSKKENLILEKICWKIDLSKVLTRR
jgi:probable rRNA maturation factor